MADWRDVMETRRSADQAVPPEWPAGVSVDAQVVAAQLEAMRLELRALGTLLDHAIGNAT